MGITHRKLLGRLAVAASLLMPMQGCALFPVSNPFLPSARLVVTPTPSQIVVSYTFSRQQNTIVGEPGESVINVSSYPKDGTPGVYFHSYSAEYFDLANKPIPSVLLSKANFGMSAYIPPASGAQASTLPLQLPIYNQQVFLYGMNQAYNFAGDTQLNPNFSHTINARVTLYGEDDNYNQVQFTFNVPIQFLAKITQ